MYAFVTLKRRSYVSCDPLNSWNERFLEHRIAVVGRAALINGLGWGLGETSGIIVR